MIFKQIKVGDMENFSYVIGDNGEAAVVDPGFEHEKLIAACSEANLKITKILLTHGHFDHVQELREIVTATGATVYVHKNEDVKTEGMTVSHVEEGDEIVIGSVKVSVLETPGHTPGGVCYLVNDTKLISGDTLFVGAIGRTDLAGADVEQMNQSLEKLKALNDSIEVYPGHDYGETPSSTIGQEKRENPYLQ